jgi:hypothetical protein
VLSGDMVITRIQKNAPLARGVIDDTTIPSVEGMN